MKSNNFENLFYIFGILIGAFIISETLRWLLKRYININSKKINVDPTNYNFLKNAASFIIYCIAIFFIIYSVPKFKNIGTTLFASAGIFAAIIALASQQALSNIISGMFIVASKPFRVGDYIEVDINFKGTVEDITLRHTIIRDLQNNRIIVPNSKINNETIVNYHLNDERKKEKIEFTIDINNDVDKAIKIIKDVISNNSIYVELVNKYAHTEEIEIKLTKIENGAIIIRSMVISEDPETAFQMHCDINYEIIKRFKTEGILFAPRVGFVNNK
ncbi:MAG: mechanosensitive ion channel family protein [Bacteroidetes bacterium]|nr:mechanosensitive ion channel family protein [Bacteroidota bacterium]